MSKIYSIDEETLKLLNKVLPSEPIASYNLGMIYHGTYETAHFIVYKNKHGRLTLVVSGKDDHSLYKQLFRAMESATLNDYKTTCSNRLAASLPNNNITSIGYDMIGADSLMGGIYSACVMVKQENLYLLRDICIKDVDQLSNNEIMELALFIRANCKHFVLNFTPSMYNKRVGVNLPYDSTSIRSMIADYTIREFAHRHFISTIVYPIIVNAFVEKSTHLQYLKSSKMVDYLDGNNLHFIKQADEQFISVACARILARERQLLELRNLGHYYFSDKSIPLGDNKDVDTFILSSLEDKSFSSRNTSYVMKCDFSNLEHCGLNHYKQ